MKIARLAALLMAAAFALSSGAALAGDAEKGKKIFNKCKACHSLEEGKKKLGPSLHGVFGRVSGTLDGFKYSKAMKEAAITWDETTMSEYLAAPKKYIPKNKMVFVGLKKQADRDNVLAYLKEATQ